MLNKEVLSQLETLVGTGLAKSPALAKRGSKKTGPGSRGGKYWLDKNGNVRYGPPPAGVKARTPEQWQAHARQLATQQLKGVKTANDLKNLPEPWEAGVSGPNMNEEGGYMHFGSGKEGHDAALASATKDAAAHPDFTYAILRVDGNYVVAAKSTKALQNDSPDKEGSAPANKPARTKPNNLA